MRVIILKQDWQSRKDLSSTNLVMMENSIAADVKFVFHNDDEDETAIDAHKCILMSRSTVFYTMFAGSMKETRNPIEIKDIDRDIFKQMLAFLYTEEIEITSDTAYLLLYAAEKYQLQLLKDKCGEFLAEELQSAEKALNLLSAAKKYHVAKLNKACVEYLSSHVDKENAALILDRAVIYEEKVLVDKVLGFLSSLGKLAIHNLHNHTLSKETLNVILSYDYWSVKEVDLFHLCANWASEACQKQGCDASGSAKRAMLGPLLYKIRFPTMAPIEFTTAVSKSGLLTADEEVSILRYLCGSQDKPLLFLCRSRNGLIINHIVPGERITIESESSWRLTGLKLKAGAGHKRIQVTKLGPSIFDYHIVAQEAGLTYFPADLARKYLTFVSASTIVINVTNCSCAAVAAQTFNTAQEQHTMEWLHEVECSFGREFSPWSGIAYQLKNE